MILGVGGMLGHDLVESAPPEIKILPFSRSQLDITDNDAVTAAVAKVQPHVLINAAAYTAVDRAESEPELAFRVNSEAVGELGRIAARAGVRVVHFSTDYVFDGTGGEPYDEDSPTNPINTYGASKLHGERALRESGADFLVLRTQWLFGAHGRSFPRTMWERACRREATRVVADQTGRPTYTADLAGGVWRLLVSGARGVFHLTNAGTATWYEIAERIFSSLGRSHLLSACRTADYPTPARRPPYSVLDTTKAEEVLQGALPSWADALNRFLRRLGESGHPGLDTFCS